MTTTTTAAFDATLTDLRATARLCAEFAFDGSTSSYWDNPAHARDAALDTLRCSLADEWQLTRRFGAHVADVLTQLTEKAFRDRWDELAARSLTHLGARLEAFGAALRTGDPLPEDHGTLLADLTALLDAQRR
jgi:hypothetical protein